MVGPCSSGGSSSSKVPSSSGAQNVRTARSPTPSPLRSASVSLRSTSSARFGGATVHDEVVAGQAAREVVLVAHQRARHHAIVRPVDGGDRQATERAAGGRLDLGQAREQALLLDGVVLVARAEIGVGTGLQLRRAEVDEQLGDVGVGEEPVVGRCGAATGGDHRHRDARGQAGQEREHHGGAPAAADQPGRPRPDQLHLTRTSLRARLRPFNSAGGLRRDQASRRLRRGAGTTLRRIGSARMRTGSSRGSPRSSAAHRPGPGGHPAPARQGAAVGVGDRRR